MCYGFSSSWFSLDSSLQAVLKRLRKMEQRTCSYAINLRLKGSRRYISSLRGFYYFKIIVFKRECVIKEKYLFMIDCVYKFIFWFVATGTI